MSRRKEAHADASSVAVEKPATVSILHALSTGDVAVMMVLATGTLFGYTMTLYPSIAGGDSGELVAESCHLGVSHPPGYPLFNMVVHLFTKYLPFGETPAWRANFFSAVCDTVAVVFIYLILLNWMAPTGWAGQRAAAFTAAALFGFSPLIWTYAVGAEVFALNNAFAALLIFLLQKYLHHQNFKSAIIGAFVCGLAMCNQHTIVLFELPIIACVLWTRKQTLWWKEFAQLTGAFTLGLLPYIYMPITAIWNPQPGSWGDVTTLTGLIHHIRRADYGTFRLYSSNEGNEGLWTRLYFYCVDLSDREIPYQLAFPVISLGLLQTLRFSTEINRHLGWFMIVTYLFYMVVFHSLANLPISEGLIYGVQMRFWQQPNVIVFAWFGVGLGYIVNLVTQVIGNYSRKLGVVISIVSRIICLALVGAQIWRWHELCNQSQAFYIRNYAHALLDPLPPNAVLFVNFDLQWTSLRYLQRCELRRPDVTVLNLSMMTYNWFATKHDHYPNIQFPGSRLVPFGSVGDGFSLASLLDVNIGQMVSKTSQKRKRFFLGGKLSYNDQDFNEKYTLVPYGLLDEFRSQATPPLSLKKWYSSQRKVKAILRERLSTLPPAELYNDETWEWTIARDHGMKQLSWATYLLERTIAEDPENLTLLSEAAKPMELSYQFEPSQFWNPASNLKNLGLAYAQMVKSSRQFNSADPFFNRVVGAGVEDSTKFIDRASERMLNVWDAWLQIPEAKQDPGYEAIKSVVRQFVPSPTEENLSQSKSGKQTQQRKKKKGSKKRATKKTVKK
ncbi:putative membrane protein [Phytophthora megakarya]|uniref:Putative membrane protein n=1 Tax=Phytophthora megakarya TaxID=4795 RepID=A0A225V4Q1_9STRA|nr:putative membrane protein [Phytophthora megakarya]